MLISNQMAASLALSVLSGVLILLAHAPFNVWWLGWVALIPLLLALSRSTPRQAAFCGLTVGVVINYGGFYWLTHLMKDFSNLGVGVYLVMLIMALFQGVPFLLWGLLMRGALPRGESAFVRWAALLVSALSFPAIEFFYPLVFPWYLANTQHTRPDLLGVVELGGAGLLSLALVVVNLCIARVLLPQTAPGEVRMWPLPLPKAGKLMLALTAVVVFGFCYGFSVWRNAQIAAAIEKAPKLNVGLVQPVHWIRTVNAMEALHDYQTMTHRMVTEAEESSRPLDLVLWPESAVRTPAPKHISKRGPSPVGEPAHFPMDLVQLIPGRTAPRKALALERVAADELLSIQRDYQVPILFGTAMRDFSPEATSPIPGRPALYNCGVLIDQVGKVVGIAPKVKLLLFGETIPFSGTFPFVYRLLPLASALLPGDGPVILDFQKARIGMMICYEDLLPWFHYELAQGRPNILLNITNDAWFGETAEAECHLSLAKMRTVEGRVYLVRSTPTGVSAVIDATGKEVARIKQAEKGTLIESVALLDIETGWERFGDTVVWLGLFCTLLFCAWRRWASATLRAEP